MIKGGLEEASNPALWREGREWDEEGLQEEVVSKLSSKDEEISQEEGREWWPIC